MSTRRRLTRHFTIEEFDCNDGTRVPKEYEEELERLCRTFLEPMRSRFGTCFVHSGYRTVTYNRAIGGARSSYHVYTLRRPRAGVAVDVSFAHGNPRRWKRAARRIRRSRRGGRGGIGYYPAGGFVHLDTRDYAADWEGP